MTELTPQKADKKTAEERAAWYKSYNPVHVHEEMGWTISLRDDLSQFEAEQWFVQYRKLRAGLETMSVTEESGLVLHAAERAKWFSEPLPKPIGDLTPGFVRWAAGKVNDHFDWLTYFPPE